MGNQKPVTSSYLEEEYENGTQVYAIYLGTCDPIFVAVYQDKVWGSGGDPLEAVYDAAKKWDSRHFPNLARNPFRQVLEPVSSSSPLHSHSPTYTPDYPTDRDDDGRHMDPHEEQLYGD